MIQDDDRLLLVATLRHRILAVLGQVRDAADSVAAYTDSSPNYLTKRRIADLIAWFEGELKARGGFRLYEFADCGSKIHTETAKAQRGQTDAGYWLAASDHLPPEAIYFRPNGRLVADGVAMERSEPKMDAPRGPCPCGGRPSKYGPAAVRVSYAIPVPESGLMWMSEVGTAVDRLHDAADRAEEKVPRSALREKLLWAMRDLEAVIMPKTIDDYLAERKIVLPEIPDA